MKKIVHSLDMYIDLSIKDIVASGIDIYMYLEVAPIMKVRTMQ